MDQQINFSAETADEITEKVAAVFKGIVKSSETDISQSFRDKGALQVMTNFLQEMAKLGLTVEETEFALDAAKLVVKQNTVFQVKKVEESDEK